MATSRTTALPRALLAVAMAHVELMDTATMRATLTIGTAPTSTSRAATALALLTAVVMTHLASCDVNCCNSVRRHDSARGVRDTGRWDGACHEGFAPTPQALYPWPSKRALAA